MIIIRHEGDFISIQKCCIITTRRHNARCGAVYLGLMADELHKLSVIIYMLAWNGDFTAYVVTLAQTVATRCLVTDSFLAMQKGATAFTRILSESRYIRRICRQTDETLRSQYRLTDCTLTCIDDRSSSLISRSLQARTILQPV